MVARYAIAAIVARYVITEIYIRARASRVIASKDKRKLSAR